MILLFNTVIATVALAFLLLPMCQYIIRPCSDGNRISFGVCGRYTSAELFSFSLALSIVCVWVLTGHWLLMDGKYTHYYRLCCVCESVFCMSIYLSIFPQRWAWDCVSLSLHSYAYPVSKYQRYCSPDCCCTMCFGYFSRRTYSAQTLW